nr:hypothetical protein [Tanacetum cinerariifolium]
MATKGNFGEVVIICERSWVQPRRGGFPSGAKKEWDLSPKAKVRVLHTAQLDVTWYYEGEMEDYKYWKAEEKKEEYKQRLINLAEEREQQIASMSRLNLFEDQLDDSSFCREEDFAYAHLGFDLEKSPKINF